jgi:hypothetical protein
MRVRGDVFDNLETLRLPDGVVVKAKAEPRKVRKRRQKFVMVPWTWIEKLVGATGHTHQVALHLLYLHCKQNGGGPLKLPNGMLKYDGISRQSKWRALADLERRGLATIERRPGKSPLIRLTE